MSKFLFIKIFIFILFLAGNLYADSTGTITTPELTQEQTDWNTIYILDSDIITALKLAKQDEKYNYLRGKINYRLVTTEIVREMIKRNKRLGRGYFGHLYPCYIENRIKKIESEDLK